MGGVPIPGDINRFSALPGPGRQVPSTGTIRPAAMSADAPPGWRSAETPGFGRAAAGAAELPFLHPHREAIARRFRSARALHDAQRRLEAGLAGELGWTTRRMRDVLADLDRLHRAIVQSNSAAAAAMLDIDWSGIEALMHIFDARLP